MTTMCVGLACLCFKPDPNCLGWQEGPLPATWGVLCARCQTYLLEQLAQCIQSSVRSRAIVPAVWGLAVSMGADVFRSRSSEVLAAADAIRAICRTSRDIPASVAGVSPRPGGSDARLCYPLYGMWVALILGWPHPSPGLAVPLPESPVRVR